MSKNEVALPDDLLADTRMAELGDVCEGLLLDEKGKFNPERLDVRRKRLCQYLGIGESTFTGWVQSERIPRAAAIAIALHRNLRERVSRMRELARDRLEPRVVVVDGKFAICEFLEREDGAVEGHLVATGIADRAVAQDLARLRSRTFAGLVGSAIDQLHFYQESDPDQLEHVGEIANTVAAYITRPRGGQLASLK